MNPYVIARQAIYWRFPSSTQRLALVAVPAEVTKIAWQASDNTLWMLVQDPGTWVEIKTGDAANYIEQISDGILAGHRVVKTTTSGKVGYADKDTVGDSSIILGITQGASVDLATAKVQYDGKMVEPSWTWTMGDAIFCGNAGVLTQVCPTTGFVCQVGVPLSPTSMLIEIHQPILIS
jgi:hypothetical protein